MREILETHITHNPFKGAWILQTSIDSLLADLKQEILQRLPKEKPEGTRPTLEEECENEGFNNCLAQVRKIIECEL